MKKPPFINNHIYHIYNRGVEKRKIFLDNKDYFRFIHDLFEFNDMKPTINLSYRLNPKSIEVQPHYFKKTRKLLVEILAFALMPNHFHLLVKQKRENGITKFMQKIGGYTMYFNQKYERVGPLFQGRFKAILIKDQVHLIHLPYYIHLNPLELMPIPNNKLHHRGSTSIKLKMDFLEKYRWSSWLDYTGTKNFPSITSREFLSDLCGGPKKYKKETFLWLKDKNIEQNLKTIKSLIHD